MKQRTYWGFTKYQDDYRDCGSRTSTPWHDALNDNSKPPVKLYQENLCDCIKPSLDNLNDSHS